MGQPGSGLIIGIDLVKDSSTLERAYADDLGVTAAFNLNVLRRVNNLLGSDFDVGNPGLVSSKTKGGIYSFGISHEAYRKVYLPE